MHRHGCCIIQQCFTTAPDRFHRTLVDAIVRDASLLLVDPFGNYVIQRLIEMGSHEQRMEIVMVNARYDVGDTCATADCRNRTKRAWYAVHSVSRGRSHFA